ncbi:hypothetical protein TNCV_3082791 [Trichonephila clavipes]|nr:hypothetical protein TNCV_3082791 [Trichonephila clavipes]
MLLYLLSTNTVGLPTRMFAVCGAPYVFFCEFQPPIPLIDTAPTTSNSLSNSAAPSSSNKALPSSGVSMFTPLPAETCPVVETISKTISSTSQAAKQTSKSRKKRRPQRSITSKILTPHKPKKSAPLQGTSDEDMLIDDDEEVESSKKEEYWLSEKYWQD